MQPYSQYKVDDSRIKWILIIGLLLQFFYCITQVGFYHPDQHFQIIEFSSYQLGRPNGATSVWELADEIRPTLQVYIFSGFVKLCEVVNITNAYTQMTILRVLFGLLGFAVFNALAFYYFKKDRRVLILVLLLINFGFALPYLRTLFSSEIASAIAFYGAILLFEKKKAIRSFSWPLLIGLLMAIAFYLRFQMAFAIAGFGLWLLFFDRNYRAVLPMLIGFVAGVAVNCWLDYQFYHHFVFTPYKYFHANISEGRAASFGTSSFLRYILMLTLVIGAPLISIFLFYYSLKSVVKHYMQPVVLSTLFFVIGHCLVAHKEERFMFPILNVLPIVAGFSLASFIEYYRICKPAMRNVLRGIIGFSVGLTALALILIIFNPYSQTIEFTRKLNSKFQNQAATLYCINRTPFETPSKLPLMFYQNSVPNVKMERVMTTDSVKYLHNIWVVTTFDRVKDSLPFLDSIGAKPVMYSSNALWSINQFIQSKKKHPINDIWVLYKKD